ncbi:conserved hypothetical protein [delta proteobacterium NaphS2]|nr:conserved hypothetical protein [delta proteobacterium NaphS2]
MNRPAADTIIKKGASLLTPLFQSPPSFESLCCNQLTLKPDYIMWVSI